MHTSLVSKSSPGQSAEAVLLEKKIKHSIVLKVPIARVRESPHPESPVKFRLYRNDRVMVIDAQNDWKRIVLDDGRSGWVHQSLFYPMNRTTSTSVVDTQMPLSVTDSQSQLSVLDTQEIHDIQIRLISETEEWVLFILNGFFTPEISVTAGENPKVVCVFSGISLGEGIQQIHILPEDQVPEGLRIVLILSPNMIIRYNPCFMKKAINMFWLSNLKSSPAEALRISN